MNTRTRSYGAAALVVLAGAGLLAAASGLGFGPAYLAEAIAVSVLVVGGFFVGKRGVQALGRVRGGEIAWFQAHPDPVHLTDLDGRLLASNAAAADLDGDAGEAPDLLDFWLHRPQAWRDRLCHTAAEAGIAEATEDGAHGSVRITVARIGRDRLLWRIEPAFEPVVASARLADLPLPWLRVDPGGVILARNLAAETAFDGQHANLGEVLVDLPLRPGEVHALAGGGRAVRVLILAERDGTQELLLLPLEAAESTAPVPNQFLDALPVALARLEPAGRLIYANTPAIALLGERAQPGVDIADLIEGLGRPIAERLQDTNKGRALGRSEVARGSVRGQEIFLQVAFTRTTLDGAPSIIAVFSDATELKALEAQFVQSQKMQAVGQLAGGIAHDFNNLLTAINGHCDLLLMRHDVADVEHGDLMQIRQNANRAAALVRQLLAFSRKQTLRPTVIDLRDTLAELAHLLNRLLTDRVVLRIEHGLGLWPVRVDERQLEQVIMNLVVNARDAMPNGGEVRITTKNVHLTEDLHRDRAVILPGDYVVIEVADSGAGIPNNALGKIFDPFFTTKPVGEGTGLGLSTAYGIVKQTGGFIFAASPPGRGATFTIYLPAYEKVESAETAPAEGRARDLTGRGHVLLVEDEEAVRSFAARALALRGYTVVEAASGEEALERLGDDGATFDVIVSDVIMPGLDGPAWVREARKTLPDAKVIFMSGYAEDAFSGGEASIAGAAFLPKPFSLNEMIEKVKDVLEG